MTTPQAYKAGAYGYGNRKNSFFVAILRDARLRRAPRDEDLVCGDILDPHGEEARSAVSNHEAPMHHAAPAAMTRNQITAFSRPLRQEALA